MHEEISYRNLVINGSVKIVYMILVDFTHCIKKNLNIGKNLSWIIIIQNQTMKLDRLLERFTINLICQMNQLQRV